MDHTPTPSTMQNAAGSRLSATAPAMAVTQIIMFSIYHFKILINRCQHPYIKNHSNDYQKVSSLWFYAVSLLLDIAYLFTIASYFA